MSSNNNQSTSQNVQDSSPSLAAGQILPPAQIRPLEESNMMNFHNTVKKTMTFTIGGNLTENRQNTQMINQNINRVISPQPIQNFNTNLSNQMKPSILASTPKPVSNPSQTPTSAPQQTLTSNIALPQSIPQINSTNANPTPKQQAPSKAVVPQQNPTNPKPSTPANNTPSQPKPTQPNPVVQRPQNIQPPFASNIGLASTNNNNNNTTPNRPTTHIPQQPQPAQQYQHTFHQQPIAQQVQHPKPAQQTPPQVNNHMQQTQPQQKAAVARPVVPQQQQPQQTYFTAPTPKALVQPNILKRPIPPKEYEGLYRERQALYQLQIHTLLQRQQCNFLKQQPEQTMEELTRQIAEVERQYLQQQQKLAELDARLVQQMQQEPAMIVRNPNLVQQHSRIQAAIEDIRKEAPKVAIPPPPKPRGRPMGTVYAPQAPPPANSGPPLKKIKKMASDEDVTETKIRPTRFHYYGGTTNYELSWVMLGSHLVKDVLTQHKTTFPDISPESICTLAADAERQKKAKKLKPNPAQQTKPQTHHHNINNNGNNNIQLPVIPAPPQPPKVVAPPPIGTVFHEENDV